MRRLSLLVTLVGPLVATESGFPPQTALAVAAADFDRDGRADLAFLLGGNAPALRIFFGDVAGFAAAKSEELALAPGITAGNLTVADLNGDGRPDIVVTAGGATAFVYWNRFWSGRGNLIEWSRTPLVATNPTAAAVADYNQDGLVDLLITGGESLVFWGHATRTFVTGAPTPLAEVGRTPLAPPPAAATAPLPVPPPVKGAEHIVIHRERGRYSAFPSLYYRREAGGGDSLHVHFGAGETTSHVESRRQQHDLVSTDGGRTWVRSERREPNPAWRTLAAPARLVGPGVYNWRYEPADQRAALEAKGYEVRNAPDGRVTYCVGAFVRTSEDGGATWQQREIPLPGQAIVNGYHDAAATLRLDDRTLLRAVFGKPAARVRYYESWLLRSEDDGTTWTFGTIAADNSRDDRGFSETALAQAGNGDIVAMMRIEPPMGTNLWVARSSDRGKTWSKAEETPLRGFPAHLLRLRDGRLLCTYGHREAPIGIRAAISRDDGRTWLKEDIVTLRSDGSGPPSDNGYPLTAQMSDGTLVTVHYLTREGITGVEATRWTDPWK